MDEQVTQALLKWPNVPDVYGFLSLNSEGQWRLHPDGLALEQTHRPGLAIEKQSIVQFFNRHYMMDKHRQWFIQNGPQRAYVRLDAAPYIVHTGSDALTLYTHTEQAIEQVKAWYFCAQGRLFLDTNLGAALLQGRDLSAVIEQLRTPYGSLEDWLLEQEQTPEHGPPLHHPLYKQAAPLYFCTSDAALRDKLAYIAHPQAF